MRLTIGMPSYNNFTEVFFTVQALRLYHDLTDCEILVVDNFGDKHLASFARNNGGGIVRLIQDTKVQGVSYAKNKVFSAANGEWVLCIDSHILLLPGAVDAAKKLEGDDFYQGPLAYSNCKKYSCFWEPNWRGHMWGTWGKSYTDADLPTEPFEIWAMGAGFFCCRRDTWLGFNSGFTGFGGESGYIQEKYRQSGRKVFCHPALKWMHLFHTDGSKIPYPLRQQERIKNYLLGFRERGRDTAPIYKEFGTAAQGL